MSIFFSNYIPSIYISFSERYGDKVLIFRTSLYLATRKFDTRIVSASKKEGEKKREEKRRKAISNWSVFEPFRSFIILDDIFDERAKREIK